MHHTKFAILLALVIATPLVVADDGSELNMPPNPPVGPEPADNSVAPTLAVQLGGGVTAAHSFTAIATMTYGNQSADEVSTNVPAGTTPKVVTTIDEPELGTAAFTFSIRDAETGNVTLAYTGVLTVKPDGNLSFQKEGTPFDEAYWTLHFSAPVLVLSQGRAAAWIVADAWADIANATSSRLVLRWGVDETGTGAPVMKDVAITQNRTFVQEFFPVLPVKTAFALDVFDGDKSLGSVRGDFFLGGLPTFESSITQVIAPLSQARIAAFRLPRNVAIVVNASEYVTTTNSTQLPSNADKLPVSVGDTSIARPELIPTCPDGQVFQMGAGCSDPPEANLTTTSTDPPVPAPSIDWKLWLGRGAWAGVVAVVALAGAAYAIGRLRR